MSTDRPDATPSAFRAARDRLVADPSVDGARLRHALTELSDAWLVEVYAGAAASLGSPGDGIALVALGGYGRGELCPGSDLDLMVVHHRHAEEAAYLAEAIWYPVWDTGVHLGHSLRSVDEAVGVIGNDVETSTALCDGRFLAGDREVAEDLARQVAHAWARSLGPSTEWLRADAAARRARAGDVAFSVEPDLKLGGGGLRDAQIPAWITRGGHGLEEQDAVALDRARAWLSDVRVALHRCGPMSGDVLHLEDQDAVAYALGIVDADELMTKVAGAARDVGWVLDEIWTRAGSDGVPTGRRTSRTRGGDTGAAEEPATDDPVAVLGHASALARDRSGLDRTLLRRIATDLDVPQTPWDAPVRAAVVDLLSSGPGMIDVVEALDHVGVWERFVPEWPAVRTRAQRTTHHRFTVDRHLLEAVVNAADHADRVERADLLVIAALFHDIGKGRGGDHTAIGVEIVESAAPRMGFSASDTATLAALVRHPLLLPEVATRRDVDDPATIGMVASAVGTSEVLDLLAALTEADARATGPTAWTDWKAGLVHTLVERVRANLAGDADARFAPAFPTADQLALLRAGDTVVEGHDRTLFVVAPDRPRLFARVTGALVLMGLNVISAEAVTADGMALEQFTVTPAHPSPELAAEMAVDWPKVTDLVSRAMSGRVALAARVAERAATYRRRHRSADEGLRIRFDDTSAGTCVVEVDAPDGVGLLFAVTTALADLDVDIRYARVETQTERVIDAFSIVDSDGAAVTDADLRAEIERAIRHAISP